MNLHGDQNSRESVGKANSSSIVTLTNIHRKNSQSRTLQRNLDSDMRSANDNYNVKTKSMLNGNPVVSNFQNNYGSFKSVNGPNATVGTSDLKGIGQIADDLN